MRIALEPEKWCGFVIISSACAAVVTLGRLIMNGDPSMGMAQSGGGGGGGASSKKRPASAMTAASGVAVKTEGGTVTGSPSNFVLNTAKLTSSIWLVKIPVSRPVPSKASVLPCRSRAISAARSTRVTERGIEELRCRSVCVVVWQASVAKALEDAPGTATPHVL